MNWIQHFMVLCSGSSLSILKKSPSEINKHAGIGGVIFFTGLLASFSAGYALYMVFDEPIWAIIFGLIWGTMICNLDRFIVSSMRKKGGFWSQLLVALPRLILAALLGIVISKPLELKIFDKEIQKQLNVIINRNKTQLQDSVNVRYTGMAANLMQERADLYAQIKNAETDLKAASLELEKEVVGTATETTTGKAGNGPNAKRKLSIKIEKQASLDSLALQLNPRIQALNTKIDSIETYKNAEIKASVPTEDGFRGFAARMQALGELSTNSKEIANASLFIMLIFVTMEMAPVLVKLIAPSGPYDELLDAHEHSFALFNKEKKTIGSVNTEERITIHEIKSQNRIKQQKEV